MCHKTKVMFNQLRPGGGISEPQAGQTVFFFRRGKRAGEGAGPCDMKDEK